MTNHRIRGRGKVTSIPWMAIQRHYKQGERAIPGVANPIKLSANECPHGPSPAALAAYRRASENMNRYPDGAQTDLRRAIAEVYGLNSNQIVCGNGSDELLSLLARAYLRPGDEVVLSENSFEMARIHSVAQGAMPVIATEVNYRIDVHALLACATERSKLCIVANPNNPTGTYIGRDELADLRAGLPSNCLLVIDGAYAEYVDRQDYDSGTALVDAVGNAIMTRSFSKIYGLAALRIGWAYGAPKVIEAIERIRTPFNTNGPALAAAAAAVQDQAHIERVRHHNSRWLRRLANALPTLGLHMVPSVANFYLIRFPANGAHSGAGAAAFLRNRGIIPRPTAAGDQYLRITIGLDDENEAVLQALTDYMRAGEQSENEATLASPNLPMSDP